MNLNDLYWPERLAINISELVGNDICAKVMAGSETLADASPKSRRAWLTEAMARLEELVPDRDTRSLILTRCSCMPSDAILAEFREMYERNPDIDALLTRMHPRPFGVRPIRLGNTIRFRKMPCEPTALEFATSEQARREAFCHCDFVRDIPGEIPPMHCQCGAGFYKNILEAVLRRPVKVELVKSVLKGDDTCEVLVRL